MRLLVIDEAMSEEQEAFLRRALSEMGLANKLIVLPEEPKLAPVWEPPPLRADMSPLMDIVELSFSAIGSGCNYFPGFGRVVQIWYGLKEIIGPARWKRAERSARERCSFLARAADQVLESRRLFDWRSSPRWGRERWRSIT